MEWQSNYYPDAPLPLGVIKRRVEGVLTGRLMKRGTAVCPPICSLTNALLSIEGTQEGYRRLGYRRKKWLFH